MERRLTAILSADVVGYSRLIGIDEAGTVSRLKQLRLELIEPSIKAHQGRVVKLMGDGVLAEFPSVVSAVACAAEIQQKMPEQSAGKNPDQSVEFRIGINLGDLIVDEDDIYGDGVNVAARLQSIARPGGIAVSGAVRDQVGNRLALSFEDRGDQHLKNIQNPVRVYDIVLGPARNPRVLDAKDERPSVAVLPFTNMSGDAEQEYFSDGITEDIITDLSKISGLNVIARHNAFTYKGKTTTVEQVGRNLGVTFVLQGSVRKAGSHVRVTGQLVDATTGRHLWAERFDRDLTDIFAIQDEITGAIVEQLKVKLLPQEKFIGQAPTDNVEAYIYYLRGREFLHRHSKSFYELGRRMFVMATELDPRYARAYAGIADCDAFLFLHYNVNLDVNDILLTADKALALNDQLSEAHASRGLALSIQQRLDEATNEFERAIALDPNSFEAVYLYARASYRNGELERAAGLFKRAAEIKPDDYQSLVLLVQTYRSLGRDEDTMAAAQETVERAERELIRHPENPRPAYLGAAALVTLGDTGRADEWLSRALSIAPDDILTQYNCAACTPDWARRIQHLICWKHHCRWPVRNLEHGSSKIPPSTACEATRDFRKYSNRCVHDRRNTVRLDTTTHSPPNALMPVMC